MLLSRVVAIMLFLLQAATVPVWAERNNQLTNHPSPYLAMHGEDPVQWQDWGEAAQTAAVREDKLLFISSGYFSCHWCHVMQRESFSNPEVAALLNKYFIPVKVDRELNPALDTRLIDFVERTGLCRLALECVYYPRGLSTIGVGLPATGRLHITVAEPGDAVATT